MVGRPSNDIRDWTTHVGHSMNTGGTGYMVDIPAQMIGAVYSQDPTATPATPGTQFGLLGDPWHTSSNQGITTGVILPTGCTSGGGFAYPLSPANIPDLGFLPAADVYGNLLNTGTHPYLTNLTTQNVVVSGTTFHEVKFPLYWVKPVADLPQRRAERNGQCSLQRARGNQLERHSVPSDDLRHRFRRKYELRARLYSATAHRQRSQCRRATMSPPLWLACASQPGCYNYPTSQQPQGQFIWANGKSDLAEAFKKIASQVLRISK